MAIVINRSTVQVVYSANTPDYPTENWIINPDISSLTGVPKKYWKISGDSVLEMDQSEKDAVDAAINALPKTSGIIFDAYNSQSQQFTDRMVPIKWNSIRIKDQGYTHSTTTNPNIINIDSDGVYEISYAVSIGQTNGAGSTAEVSIARNGSTVNGSYSYSHSNGECHVSSKIRMNLSSSDTIMVCVRRKTGQGNFYTYSEGCQISIIKII